MGADIGLNKTSQWSDEIPDGQVVAAELRKPVTPSVRSKA